MRNIDKFWSQLELKRANEMFWSIIILVIFDRFIGGVADAAALGSILSILMKLFPNYVTTIVSWTEMLFGLGYMLGLKMPFV